MGDTRTWEGGTTPKRFNLGGLKWYIIRGAQIFQKSDSHLKSLASGRLTWSNFNAQDSQAHAIAQNSVVRTTWQPGFVHPCIYWNNKISKDATLRYGDFFMNINMAAEWRFSLPLALRIPVHSTAVLCFTVSDATVAVCDSRWTHSSSSGPIAIPNRRFLWRSWYADSPAQMTDGRLGDQECAVCPRGMWPTGQCTQRWCGENRVKGERFSFSSWQLGPNQHSHYMLG
jgi:hypothetical protein